MEMQSTPPSFVERFFKVREKGSTVRTELLAGMTTFIAMAYILFVNPNILADAGIPKEAAIASTIWIAALASLAMGIFANYPVALAPGMGLNAFFAYYVCGVLGLHWTVALGAVFFSGVLFLILTVGGIRQAIINAVPRDRTLYRVHRPEGDRADRREFRNLCLPWARHRADDAALSLRTASHGGVDGAQRARLDPHRHLCDDHPRHDPRDDAGTEGNHGYCEHLAPAHGGDVRAARSRGRMALWPRFDHLHVHRGGTIR